MMFMLISDYAEKRICTEYRVYNRAQYSMRIWKIYAHKIEFTYQSQKTLNFKEVLVVQIRLPSSEGTNFFEHPTRRHIFANTVGRICQLDLTLRHKNLSKHKNLFFLCLN